jgi:hypothetical protein
LFGSFDEAVVIVVQTILNQQSNIYKHFPTPHARATKLLPFGAEPFSLDIPLAIFLGLPVRLCLDDFCCGNTETSP